MPFKPTKPNKNLISIDEIRMALKRESDKNNYVRLKAIYDLVCESKNKDEVVRDCDINLRTLNRWINRFNESGIVGLYDKSKSGRPSKISETNGQIIINLVENPHLAQVNHWTGKKLHGYLKKNCLSIFSYHTLLRFLRKNDYRFLMPRKWPAKQDQEKRTEFLKTIAELFHDPNAEIFFADESGFSGDPIPRRRIALKGSKPTIIYQGAHIRASIVGAVQPFSGELFALVFKHNNDRETFQCFLEHVANETAQRKDEKKIYIVLDNAAWHKAKSLNWFHLTPLYLPPYSPDFNPIEELWKYIKEHFFADLFFKSYQELEDKLCETLLVMFDSKQIVSSVASINCVLK